MKRIKWFLLISLAALFVMTGCGLIPIAKEGLREGEALAVDIESVTFYEKLIITDVGEDKSKYEVDRTSPARTDEYSQEFVKRVKEVLLSALRDRGVVVVPGAPTKIQVIISENFKSSVVIRVMTGRIFSRGDPKALEAWSFLVTPDPARPIFAPNGWRNLSVARFAARQMSEVLANSLIARLRESESKQLK